MPNGLSAFTVRNTPVTPATPYLFLSGLSVIGSLCWLLANAHGPQFQLMAATLVVAIVVVTSVIVRLERRATRLASALVGLPEPRGGWTPAEERAIESVSEDGIDVAAMFAQGGLADYVGVTVVLITAEIPALAVLGGLTEVHWAAFIVVLSLGAVAIAALAYAWRADVYLREHLVPLADRIADTQMTLLLEAA